MERRARRRPYAFAIALCILLAVCAGASVLIVRSGKDAPAPSGQRAAEVLSASGRAKKSAPDSFMDDLARSCESHGAERSASVYWEEGRALPDAAHRVLDSYREAGTWSVSASGYLDLWGRAWGALLQEKGGAVDVVLVFGEQSEEESYVHVGRMEAAG